MQTDKLSVALNQAAPRLATQNDIEFAYAGACSVLNTGGAVEKACAARSFRALWLKRANLDSDTLNAPPVLSAASLPPPHLPMQPARPLKPELVAPPRVPRRRLGTQQGRGSLLHAIAHIEMNAIDLAADMIARFMQDTELAPQDRYEFINDWSSVCDDEARHFMLLEDRLQTLGMTYGDCLAHNGLWNAAVDTRGSFAARLAIAPLVLEARGLDVTPGMIKKLTQVGDTTSAEILNVIYSEEINHVRIGAKWFQYIAKSREESPKLLFQSLVKTYFKGQIKPPINVQARSLAGLSEEYYAPLVKEWNKFN